MAANYLPYDPLQMMLLPEAMQEWLPEGHLAYFVGDAVDGLDLSAFHARYETWPSECWAHATSPRIARSATSGRYT